MPSDGYPQASPLTPDKSVPEARVLSARDNPMRTPGKANASRIALHKSPPTTDYGLSPAANILSVGAREVLVCGWFVVGDNRLRIALRAAADP